jgi:hypothetical protein
LRREPRNTYHATVVCRRRRAISPAPAPPMRRRGFVAGLRVTLRSLSHRRKWGWVAWPVTTALAGGHCRRTAVMRAVPALSPLIVPACSGQTTAAPVRVVRRPGTNEEGKIPSESPRPSGASRSPRFGPRSSEKILGTMGSSAPNAITGWSWRKRIRCSLDLSACTAYEC